MIETLCKLCQSHEHQLNLSITHTKVTDWCVTVTHRLGVGEDEPIISTQSCDINRACAEAYIEVTDWLCEHNGGY